jgi:hypothetical protein
LDQSKGASEGQAVAGGKIRAAELREKYIHAHAVAREAIGRLGIELGPEELRVEQLREAGA